MKTYTSPERKLKKVLVEKRRRMRIDRALLQMKQMVLENLNVQQPEKYDKMEKADILDLTVRFLKRMRQEKQPIGGGMETEGHSHPYMAPFMGGQGAAPPMGGPSGFRPMVAHPIPIPAAYMNMYPTALRPQMPSAVKLEPHPVQDFSRFSPRVPVDMSLAQHIPRSAAAAAGGATGGPSATVTSSCIASSAKQELHEPTASCSCAPSTSSAHLDEDHVTSSTPSTSASLEPLPSTSGLSTASGSKAAPSGSRKRQNPSPQHPAENIPAKLFRLERELIDGMWRPWNFA